MSDSEINTLKQRLDVLESQDSVRRLKAEYMQACDEKRGRAIADLFWEDGVWEALGGSPYGATVGRDAIADLFEASPKRLTFTTHYLMNEAIEVDGDKAVGRWKLFEPCTFKDRVALWMGGWYVDDFERRDGEWRIKHLRLSVEFRTAYDEGWLRERFTALDG